MGRSIPDVAEHTKCLDNRGRKIVTLLRTQITSSQNKPSRLYVHQPDFVHIKSLMGGSGFDVARGFRCEGVTVAPFNPE